MPDLVSIFLNLSQSLGPIQFLVTGLGYVIGIAFVLAALGKVHLQILFLVAVIF